MYRAITDALHREMDMLEERFANGNPMSSADLDMIDKAAHALKCIATYEAMTESDYEYKRKRYDTYRRY